MIDRRRKTAGAQELRQLGDVNRNPPRLIARKQLGCALNTPRYFGKFHSRLEQCQEPDEKPTQTQ
jgi:hypothetical protein